MRNLMMVILLSLIGCGPAGLPADDPDGGADALEADGATCGGPWQLCCAEMTCDAGLTCRRIPSNLGTQTRICVP